MLTRPPIVLGKSYFELAQAVYRATRFDDVVELLVAKLPGLIGTDEAVVLGSSPISGVCSVSNHGPIAKLLSEKMDVMNRMADKHPIVSRVNFDDPGDLGFAMSDHISPEEYRNSEFAQAVYGDLVVADALFGQLVAGVRRKAYLTCYFSATGIPVQARERFDAILLTVRGVLDRMEAHNVERVVRQRIFGASAPLAVFFINQASEVCPLNHAAVTFAESRWAPDEAVRLLSPDQVALIDRVVDTGWINPITADWRDAQLDLGAGPAIVHALPKLSGEVILMFPVSGHEPAGEEAVTILTRRQREIMDWIAEGKTSAEAAIILGISPRTVEKHLEAVFQRLGVENRIAAMRRYLDLKRGL